MKKRNLGFFCEGFFRLFFFFFFLTFLLFLERGTGDGPKWPVLDLKPNNIENKGSGQTWKRAKQTKKWKAGRRS